MCAQPTAKEDSPLGVTPPARPRSPWRVREVTALPGFRLEVRFADGLHGVVDMSRLVVSNNAGVFAALADPARFSEVLVEQGVVTWPGEIDLAPDAMYKAIKTTGQWVLR